MQHSLGMHHTACISIELWFAGYVADKQTALCVQSRSFSGKIIELKIMWQIGSLTSRLESIMRSYLIICIFSQDLTLLLAIHAARSRHASVSNSGLLDTSQIALRVQSRSFSALLMKHGCNARSREKKSFPGKIIQLKI